MLYVTAKLQSIMQKSSNRANHVTIRPAYCINTLSRMDLIEFVCVCGVCNDSAAVLERGRSHNKTSASILKISYANLTQHRIGNETICHTPCTANIRAAASSMLHTISLYSFFFLFFFFISFRYTDWHQQLYSEIPHAERWHWRIAVTVTITIV